MGSTWHTTVPLTYQVSIAFYRSNATHHVLPEPDIFWKHGPINYVNALQATTTTTTWRTQTLDIMALAPATHKRNADESKFQMAKSSNETHSDHPKSSQKSTIHIKYLFIYLCKEIQHTYVNTNIQINHQSNNNASTNPHGPPPPKKKLQSTTDLTPRMKRFTKCCPIQLPGGTTEQKAQVFGIP